MRRLSLFSTIEFALRMKRRFSRPEPMPDIEIPPAAIIEPVPEVQEEWHEAIAAASEESAVVEIVAIPSHALDSAPINSKIVVVREAGVTSIILALPSGEQVLLGGDDIAIQLPVGAKIQKTADGEFLASQLGGNEAHPALVTGTAHEAITGFVPHFHEVAA